VESSLTFFAICRIKPPSLNVNNQIILNSRKAIIRLSEADVTLITALERSKGKLTPDLNDPTYLALARAHFAGSYQAQIEEKRVMDLLMNKVGGEAMPKYEEGRWTTFSFNVNSSLPPVQMHQVGEVFPRMAGIVKTVVDFDLESITHEVGYVLCGFMQRINRALKPIEMSVDPDQINDFLGSLAPVYQIGNRWVHADTARLLYMDWPMASMAEALLLKDKKVASSWWFDAGDENPEELLAAGMPFEIWKFLLDAQADLSTLGPAHREAVEVIRAFSSE